jgi:hypothetical protein
MILGLAIAFQTPAWAGQIPACQSVSLSATNAAQQAAERQFCQDAAACISGTQKCSRKIINSEAKAIFSKLQGSLPPFCAASIVAVLVQQVVDGKLNAGSCPAPH